MNLIKVSKVLEGFLENLDFEVTEQEKLIAMDASLSIEDVCDDAHLTVHITDYFAYVEITLDYIDYNFENLTKINTYNEDEAYFFKASISDFGDNDFLLTLTTEFFNYNIKKEKHYADLIFKYILEFTDVDSVENLKPLLDLTFKK